MFSSKIEAICNEQIEKEGYSSNLYLSMASWSERNGFPGVAEWFYAQAMEEKDHMLKFIKYVNDRGGKAIIPALDQPTNDFAGIKEIFANVLEHEMYISKCINDIVGLAFDEKDFTTNSWLQWFVNEQIEEESSVRTIIDKLNMLDNSGLYLFDKDIMTLRGSAAAAE